MDEENEELKEQEAQEQEEMEQEVAQEEQEEEESQQGEQQEEEIQSEQQRRARARNRQMEKAKKMMNQKSNPSRQGKRTQPRKRQQEGRQQAQQELKKTAEKQAAEQAKQRMAEKATQETMKKAAEEGAKAAAKATAKAGAGAAKTGAVGAGCGGGCVSGCGIVVIAIIIIMLLIGLISFISNMPDAIIGKIMEWWDDTWRPTRVFWSESVSKALASERLENTAQYIENMGYDLVGYGFLDPGESEEDEGKKVNYQYLELQVGEYNSLYYQNTLIGYYMMVENGSGLDLWQVQEGNLSRILGTENEERHIYISYSSNSDWGKAFRRNWGLEAKPASMIVRFKIEEDGEGCKKLITTDKWAFDTYKGFHTVLEKDENGNILYVESRALLEYLAAEERTYMFKGQWSNIHDWWQGAWKDILNIFHKGEEKPDSDSREGMIEFEKSVLEEYEEDFKGFKTVEKETNEDGEEEVVKKEITVSIDRAKRIMEIPYAFKNLGDKPIKFGAYNYDLVGWTGKYGKPIEFSLAMHLTTMSPDFTYQFVTDEDLESVVHINFAKIPSSRRLLKDGEDAQNAEGQRLQEELDAKIAEIESYKEKIETNNTLIKKYESEIGRIDASGDLENKRENLKELIKKHEDENAKMQEILDTFETDEVQADIEKLRECFSADILKEEGRKEVESIVRTRNYKWVQTWWVFGYNITGLNDLLNMNLEIDTFLNICKYNDHYSNVPINVPYITEVTNHWYRNLYFGTIQGVGYTVKIDESGAAPAITDRETLVKILKSYSNTAAAERMEKYVDTILEIQEKYKVNALFTAAVGIIESRWGTASNENLNSRNNWFSISGKSGNYWIRASDGHSFNGYSSPEAGIEAFGALIGDIGAGGASDKYYFGKGNITVGAIAEHYCNAGWGEKVNKQMQTFYKYAEENGLIGGNTSSENTIEETDDTNFCAYEVDYSLGETYEVAPVEQILEDQRGRSITTTEMDGSGLSADEYTVQVTIAYGIKQVSEPKVYDNSKRIKELLGVTDINLKELYKKELQELVNGKTEETEENTDEDSNEETESTISTDDEAWLKLSETYKEKAKYYIFSGRGRSEEKQNISPTKSSITAMAILESVHTEDAAHILKDFKELFNDVGFEVELEEDVSSIEKSNSLKWIFKSYVPGYDWPEPNEIPVLEGDRSTYSSKPFAYVVRNGNQSEEDRNGFTGDDELIAPGNCIVRDIGEDYIALEFTDVTKTEKKQVRKYSTIRQAYELVEEEEIMYDNEVNGMVLYVYGLKVAEGIEKDQKLQAETKIGTTIADKDIEMVMKDQLNSPIVVSKYIYPPDMSEVVFDLSGLTGVPLEVWTKYQAEITEMAIKYGLDPYAIIAVICVESSGKLDDYNGIAYGLMQSHVKYHAIKGKTLIDVDGNKEVKDCSPSAMKGNASLQIECGCSVLRSYIFYPWPDGNWFKGLGSYNIGPSGIQKPGALERFRNGYWGKKYGFVNYFCGGEETWAIRKVGSKYYQVFTSIKTGEITREVEVSWPPAGGLNVSIGGGSQHADGDGYSSTYTSSAGRTFKEFKQSRGSYSGQGYSQGTISTSGCGPTSVAIVLSGYGIDVDPGDIAKAMGGKNNGGTNGSNLAAALRKYGLGAKYVGSLTVSNIRAQLQSGKEIVVSVGPTPDHKFTGSGHIMAILDINSNDEVYISNPNPRTYNGWIKLTTFIKYCSYKYGVFVQ